ncbi:MAG: glycosyltransferase family 4 protein [Cyanobacteria bacterium P01_H01_bin.21]
MKILFLDQTGKLAGAERVLLDLATSYKDNCLVCLFEDGPFRKELQAVGVEVRALRNPAIEVRRESNLFEALQGAVKLLPLVQKTISLSKQHDLIYVNTPKALVVGAIASCFSRRPMVYHLHDILTLDHFSKNNRQLMVTLANRFATQVMAVSEAAKKAFIQAGGRSDIVQVVYNGFEFEKFQGHNSTGQFLRDKLNVKEKFVVGHFSRLSPWKGQHVLIEALLNCPDHIHVLIVGDALFGEDDYVQQLHQQVERLDLTNRVHFLGFRTDVPQLMAACDVIAHTSTSPEPCARVLIEAMLSGKPLVASKDGGTLEIIEDQTTGWFVPPGDSEALAHVITHLSEQTEFMNQVAQNAQQSASKRFTLSTARENVDRILKEALIANHNYQGA